MHFGTKSKECVTEGVTLEMFQIPLPVPYILMPLQFRQESLAPLQYHTPQRQTSTAMASVALGPCKAVRVSGQCWWEALLLHLQSVAPEEKYGNRVTLTGC